MKKGLNELVGIIDRSGSMDVIASDAIGRTTVTVGERLSNTDEDKRPEKVIVFILTDGMENASREYDKKKVTELINRQRDEYKWEFIFLSASQEAIQEGIDLGINQKDTQLFAHTGKGVSQGYTGMSSRTTSYRT